MSSFQISSQNLPTTTLTDLVDRLGQTSSKHDGKSIRLHAQPFGDTTVKVHTTWSRPGHGTERQEKRRDALNLVKQAMMHEYEIDEKAAGKILDKLCTKPGRISLGQLKTLGKVMELKQTRDPRMEKVKEFQNLTLGNLGQLTDKLAPTRQGGTGAMIIEDTSLPYDGIILKCESPDNANAAAGTSDYILKVSKELAGNGVELPFDAMVIEKLGVDQNVLEGFSNHLEKNRDVQNATQVDRCKEKLGFARKETMVPMKGMFLKDMQDISSLPVEDRLGLLKGNEFPRSIGGVMMMSKLFGLADHVGLGLIGEHGGGSYTNLSNLMINPETKRVAIIDYAFANGGRKFDENKQAVSGFTAPHVKIAFEKLKDIAQKISSSPSTAFQHLSNREDVSMDQFVEQMTACFDEGTLFIKNDEKKIDETAQLNSLTATDKNKFVINTLIGALDALKLIAENSDAFKKGTPMFDSPEEVLPHLVKLANGIDSLRDKLVEYVNNN